MTQQPVVAVPQDHLLTLCRDVINDRSRPIPPSTAIAIATLIAHCPTRDSPVCDEPGLSVLLAIIGAVADRISELAHTYPAAAFGRHQSQIAELAANTIICARIYLTASVEQALLRSARDILADATLQR